MSENPYILEDVSQERIPPAIVANHVAYGALLSELPGGRLHDEPAITWFETGVPLDMLNGVLQVEVGPDELPTAIDRVLAHFQARRLAFHWRVGPTAAPPTLGELLQARGIAHVEDEPAMAVDLHAVQENLQNLPLCASLQIAPVTTDALLATWMRVWGCGAPDEVISLRLAAYRGLSLDGNRPLRLLLGILDGAPVATGALFLGGGVASVEDVVTLPAFRRQGIGAAITLGAARAARDAGYRVAVLSASAMGIGIYRRLGFCEYGVCGTYEWHPAAN